MSLSKIVLLLSVATAIVPARRSRLTAALATGDQAPAAGDQAPAAGDQAPAKPDLPWNARLADPHSTRHRANHAIETNTGHRCDSVDLHAGTRFCFILSFLTYDFNPLSKRDTLKFFIYFSSETPPLTLRGLLGASPGEDLLIFHNIF